MTLLTPSLTLRGLGFGAGVPLLALCAGVGGASAVTACTSPTYQATSSVLVISDNSGSHNHDQNPQPVLAQNLMPTVVRLAESDTVARATALEAHLPTALVAGHVNASAQPEVQIVTLRANAATADRAAVIANAMAHVLNAQLDRRQLGAGAYLRAQPLDQATSPQRPVEPKPLLNAALGGALGLLGGLSLVASRRSRDDRLYSTTDIESELGTLVLAGIPRISPWASRHGVHEAYHRADVGNSIRTAVATLAAVSPKTSGQRLLVTSVRNDDSKAVLTALLALGLTEQYEHVALVEGQLHQPVLGRYFPNGHEHTLQEWLGKGVLHYPSALLHTPQLTVIHGQRSDPQHSAALLRGDAFPRVLDHLAQYNDVVLMHAPPVLDGADFAALARHADAVVLVVRAGATRGRDAQRALSVLRLIGSRVAGVVVTDTAEGGSWVRRRPSAGPGSRRPGHPATAAARLPATPPRGALAPIAPTDDTTEPAVSSGDEAPSPSEEEGKQS